MPSRSCLLHFSIKYATFALNQIHLLIFISQSLIISLHIVDCQSIRAPRDCCSSYMPRPIQPIPLPLQLWLASVPLQLWLASVKALIFASDWDARTASRFFSERDFLEKNGSFSDKTKRGINNENQANFGQFSRQNTNFDTFLTIISKRN